MGWRVWKFLQAFLVSGTGPGRHVGVSVGVFVLVKQVKQVNLGFTCSASTALLLFELVRETEELCVCVARTGFDSQSKCVSISTFVPVKQVN